MTIKISEIFGGNAGDSMTLQGEGKYAGVPSIFIRTFGCNHRCPGFGLPKGTTENEEVKEYIAKIPLYKNILEMPVAKTGCDTYMAVYPQFKNFAPKMTIEEIVNDVKGRADPKNPDIPHIVITGGEPLLPGWQKEYQALIRCLVMEGFRNFTFETNATQPLSTEFFDFIYGLTYWAYQNIEVVFSMSPKLSCSGEPAEEAIKIQVIEQYRKLAPNSYLKFVVGDADDVKEVLAIRDRLINPIPIYLMPIGGASVELTEKDVYHLARKNGMRFSPRLQVSLAGNGAGV